MGARLVLALLTRGLPLPPDPAPELVRAPRSAMLPMLPPLKTLLVLVLVVVADVAPL